MRILSSIILASVALIATYFGGMFFEFVLCGFTALATLEWACMDVYGLKTVGYLMIYLFYKSILALRQHHVAKLLRVFTIVWISDIAALVFGKYFGGPKLNKFISPNKTYAGIAGGLAIGTLSGLVLNLYFQNYTPKMLLECFLISCVALCGDLFESFAKRLAQVKDSNLPGLEIPGHGGFLDRLDSLIFAAPFAYYVLN